MHTYALPSYSGRSPRHWHALEDFLELGIPLKLCPGLTTWGPVPLIAVGLSPAAAQAWLGSQPWAPLSSQSGKCSACFCAYFSTRWAAPPCAFQEQVRLWPPCLACLSSISMASCSLLLGCMAICASTFTLQIPGDVNLPSTLFSALLNECNFPPPLNASPLPPSSLLSLEGASLIAS